MTRRDELLRKVQANPESEQAHFDLGISYQGSDEGVPLDFRASVASLSRALEINPNFGDAYLYRGIANDAREEPYFAINDFSSAIAAGNCWSECYAYELRAGCYSRLKKYDMAIADYTSAITVHSGKNDRPLGNLYIGRAYARNFLGDQSAALVDCDEAVKADPLRRLHAEVAKKVILGESIDEYLPPHLRQRHSNS